MRWWQESWHYAPRARTEGLLSRCGMLRTEQPSLTGGSSETRTHWAERLVLRVWSPVSDKKHRPFLAKYCEQFAYKIKADPSLGEALCALHSLSGDAAVRAWVREQVQVPAPPKPRAERAQELVARRAKEAIDRLARYERGLKAYQRLVKKWRGKVRYYARKGIKV